jgi:hypothetical protein
MQKSKEDAAAIMRAKQAAGKLPLPQCNCCRRLTWVIADAKKAGAGEQKK